ncbi:Longin domain [Trypanosoma melophagium]|uniref:Longin domain n=1 Tax=Trypanosoma melophagium TaxID=715481 RepID=UPI003519DAA9|nr:Longin domain [Trypanosoma melophagium]
MLHFTLIVRQRDALALAADTDTCSAELEQCKVVAKTLLRKLAIEYSNPSTNLPPLLTIVWKNYVYHVLSESGVSFLTMCDTATPAGVAFAFLEDVAREFLQQYGPQVESATRPYCFIKFDLYLQRIKKVFSTSNSSRSMNMLGVGRQPPVRRTFEEIMTGAESKMGGLASSRSIVDGRSDSMRCTLLVAPLIGVTVLVLLGIFYLVTLN